MGKNHQGFTGGNHGGKRQFIGLPGQLTQLVDGEVPRLIGTLDNSTKIDAILGNGLSLNTHHCKEKRNDPHHERPCHFGGP